MLLRDKTKTMVGGLCVDFVKHRASYGRSGIKLFRNEQKVLETLIKNLDQAVCRESLVKVLYGDRMWSDALRNTLKVNVCTLRQKLYKATGKNFIQTIPWLGYQFVKPENWYPVYLRPKRVKKCESNMKI